eukprot:363440-Chlamydomonas_euryale.AAC.5
MPHSCAVPCRLPFRAATQCRRIGPAMGISCHGVLAEKRWVRTATSRLAADGANIGTRKRLGHMPEPQQMWTRRASQQWGKY